MADDKQQPEAVQEDAPSSRRTSLDNTPFDFRDPQFSSDEFRIWEMKIKRCPKARPHDWTMCPYAHPGEKAKRRDPRRFTYSGTACAEYRKTGQCARGDACSFAHGVFECWLHPNRYRTQLCTDGTACKRRVCFFAHQESELRHLEGSPAPGLGPGSQLQADVAVEALALQGQTQIAQALHNYLEQQKSQQEQAITAAAQLLDPMAKLRLMKALQDQQQATTARLDAIDPALLSALQGLAMHTPTQLPPVPVTAAAALSRHSMDGGVSYGGMHQPPPLRPAVHASFSRRSVDIGSVARGEAGLMPMGLPPQAPQAFAGAARPVNLNDFAVPPAVAASSFAMSSGVAVSAPSPQAPLLLGSLPTASYMEFAAGRGRNTGGDGRGSTTSHLYSAGDVAGSVGAAAGGQLPAEEPSLVPSASDSDRSGRLHSIDEANPYEETGDTSSASSSVVNSSNASSSGDHLLVKGHGTTVQRVMSFDNILAELPRSASQVNMVEMV